MILTGPEIISELRRGRITIDPFDERRIEPNSYGFRLAPHLICYAGRMINVKEKPVERLITLSQSGYCLEPGRFYLGSTLETLGSDYYAATLYARRSVSTLGMWIQFSAPLGHTGAVIAWTLEIAVTHPVIVYPGMLIGKIAFWQTQGTTSIYHGKYTDSTDVVSSRLSQEYE
jgi:dCTP deaminase